MPTYCEVRHSQDPTTPQIQSYLLHPSDTHNSHARLLLEISSTAHIARVPHVPPDLGARRHKIAQRPGGEQNLSENNNVGTEYRFRLCETAETASACRKLGKILANHQALAAPVSFELLLRPGKRSLPHVIAKPSHRVV